MAGIVLDGLAQVIAAQGLDAATHALFLRGADFEDQVSPGLQVTAGLFKQAFDDGVSARTAVQGQVRLVIADARRQLQGCLPGRYRADC